jgi:rfaE bifunctional protein nucleotidyltransferase chain/domain
MRGNVDTLEEVVSWRRAAREAGRTVVWTNGCFDLFHAGHVRSLEAARALGGALVVGLNADESVRRLKGPRRPYCPQEDRVAVLAALGCVDRVVIFSGDRCVPELEALAPDIYAKGEDYTLETIDAEERAAVEGGGGRVVLLPLVPGRSTSLLLKQIRRGDPEKIISAAFGLVRDDAGRLLLVASEYPEGIRWGLPGGGQNRGETLDQTVRRELREEVGLTVTAARHRGVIERMEPALDLHLVLHLYEVETAGISFRIDPEDENVVDAAFLDREQLRNHEGWILGREHWIRYLEAPETFAPYIYMGPGEE